MIRDVTLGTNDMEKSAAFYDALLATIGAGRFMEGDHSIAWTMSSDDTPVLSIIKLTMAAE